MKQVLTTQQQAQLPKALEQVRDKELRALGAKLGVTPEQKQRIDQLHADYAKKFQALAGQNNGNVSQEFSQLRHELFGAIRHELTAQQQAKLPEVLQQEFTQWRNPEARRERQKALAEQLGLNAEQQKQLDQIHQQFLPKVEKVAKQLQELWQSERSQVENVLTAEQRARLQKMQEGNNSTQQNTVQPSNGH